MPYALLIYLKGAVHAENDEKMLLMKYKHVADVVVEYTAVRRM